MQSNPNLGKMRFKHFTNFNLLLRKAEVESDASDSLQNLRDEDANRPPSLVRENFEILVEDANIAVKEAFELTAVLFDSQHPGREG